jgi:GTP 3',8-cyclase
LNPDHAQGRPIYLRLSLTDGCNLRCRYCRPAHSVPADAVPPASDAELLGLLGVLREELTLYKLRLTGGEPLLRPGLPALVARLRAQWPDAHLAMTTNGILLPRRAAALRAAGLESVNLSLDAADAESFRRLSRGGRLDDVLAGLRAARRAGFAPVKINTVLIRSVNGRGLADLVRLAAEAGCEIRFIELMPCGEGAMLPAGEFLSADEALARLSDRFEYLGAAASTATARRHRLRVEGRETVVGFISAVSRPFCDGCDRLRLDCRGRLLGCLRRSESIDLLTPYRAGDREAVRRAVRLALAGKGPPDATWPGRHMVAIGG